MRLIVRSRSGEASSVDAGERLVIGRDEDCDLLLEDVKASRHHAVIARGPDPGTLTLKDLGSTNGTFLGDDRIDGSIVLRGGEQIRIGETYIEVVRAAPATVIDQLAPTTPATVGDLIEAEAPTIEPATVDSPLAEGQVVGSTTGSLAPVSQPIPLMPTVGESISTVPTAERSQPPAFRRRAPTTAGRRRRYWIIAGVCVLVLVLGLVAGAFGHFDGDWVGTTAQGHEIAFTVEGGEVVHVEAGVTAASGGCELETTGEVDVPIPIANGSFSTDLDSTGDTFLITAALSEDGTASGLIEFSANNATCGLVENRTTWEAVKA